MKTAASSGDSPPGAAAMDFFTYQDGGLRAEGVPVADIARRAGTPFYCYSAAAFESQYRLLDEALEGLERRIFFAVKANSNQAVLRLMASLGAGMDVVSAGEYLRAKAAGVPGESVVFSGVGKTEGELRMALEGGIRQFNAESEPELSMLSEVAQSLGKTAPVAIRVNPDVDAKTHEKISTGKAENKFGVPISRAREAYRMAASLPGLRVTGIDMHIGSQLSDLAPYESAFGKMAKLAVQLREDGHDIARLDLGGGLGIPYGGAGASPPSPKEYGDIVRRALGHLGCEIEVEPGRLIAGNAGIMVSSVIHVKEGEGRTFVVLDSAMNDLIRPAMYEAHHEIVPVAERDPEEETFPVDVVGPVCESADVFATRRPLPRLRPGDLVAFKSAGAYGAVMSSEYNTRPLIPEVLVKGGRFAVVRPRPALEEIIARDSVPEWL